MIVDCAIYRDGQRAEGPQDLSDALGEARTAGGFVWIGLHEPTESEFDHVAREFGLHPLAVEDALKAHQRPKLEVYDDSLFVVLKPVVYEPDSDKVSSGEIMIVLGDAFAVSAAIGGSPRSRRTSPMRRYEGRKSWPHWETQCASSTARRETFRRAARSRKAGLSNRSGAT